MSIRIVSPYVTNQYKQLRDISNQIKRIKAQTQYIRTHHVEPPRTLSYNKTESKYSLKRLNIL